MKDWQDWTVTLSVERAKEIMGGVMKPTPEEKQNGWTEDSLTIYLAERKQSEITKLYPKKKKPTRTKSRMRWLRR